eukprot:gene17855-24244_t
MGFIDIDEFIVIHERQIQGINQLLRRCTPKNHKYNTQFKTFVNTAYGPTMYSPHRAHFSSLWGNNYLVNELRQAIPRGRNLNSTHTLASVYHYSTKSRE